MEIKPEDLGKRCLLKFGEDYISGILMRFVDERIEVQYNESFKHGDTTLTRVRNNTFLPSEIMKIL